MKFIKKRLSIIVVALVFVMSISSVFALDQTAKSYLTENGRFTGGAFSCSGLSQNVHYSITPNDGEVVELSCSNGTYGTVYITKEQESNILDTINKRQQAADSQTDVEGKLDGITAGFAVGADTEGATELVSGFLPFISLLLGIICVIITIGMGILSALDIMYITFPMFQEKCNNARDTGKGAFGTRNKSDGTTKMRFVSRDAQLAVEQSNTGESGTNPLITYFKNRLITYIILAMLLFLLLTGNITIITDLAVRVISGFMSVLEKATA